MVVPAGVVEIERDAFTGYDMESITIPEGCRKVSIDTYVKTIHFPSAIDAFYLTVSEKELIPEKYDMNEIVIPSGCKIVTIRGYVKTLRLPSTIEMLSLSAGKARWGDRRPADDVYFAPGTKKIIEKTPLYFKLKNDPTMKFHIPSSVIQIEEHSFQITERLSDLEGSLGTVEYVYDNIDSFSADIRAKFYRKEGRCQHCGGAFKYVRDGLVKSMITGKWCYKCKVCGEKKDY